MSPRTTGTRAFVVVLTTVTLTILVPHGARAVPPAPGDDGPLVAEGEVLGPTGPLLDRIDRQATYLAVAFSPDGLLLASGSADRVVRLWDLRRRRLLLQLVGHTSAVTSVAFSPDGNLLASASQDRSVRLWDPRSGKLVRQLVGHVYHVYGVAFSPDGKTLASVSWDRTLQLWEVATGAQHERHGPTDAALRSVAFSPDGRQVVVGSENGTLEVYSVTGHRRVARLAGHRGAVTAIAFLDGGRVLCSASEDHTLRLWNMPRGLLVRVLSGHEAAVTAVAASARGLVLASASADHTLKLWDWERGRLLGTRHGEHAAIFALALDPSGSLVATAGADRRMTLWDLATASPAGVLQGQRSGVLALASSPSQPLIAAGSEDGAVHLWDPTRGRYLGLLASGSPAITALAFSSDGKTLAVGAIDGSVLTWRLSTRRATPLRPPNGTAVRSMVFAPTGQTLLLASDDPTVEVWEVASARMLRELDGHRAPVLALALDHDGETLVSASTDRTVRLWELPTGRPLRVLVHKSPVQATAIQPDGALIATGDSDGRVALWRTSSGRRLKRLDKPDAAVLALAWDERGQTLLATTDAGEVWRFDRGLGSQRKRALAQAPLTAATFTVDGTVLAVAGLDGAVRLLDPATLEPRALLVAGTAGQWLACQENGRCMRRDHGTLLAHTGTTGPRGPTVPATMTTQQSPLSLVSVAGQGLPLPRPLTVADGTRVRIPFVIRNPGPRAALWIQLVQEPAPRNGSSNSLVFIPPPVHPRLGPGEQITLFAELAGATRERQPEAVRLPLRVAFFHAGGRSVGLQLHVILQAPHVELRGARLIHGEPATVVVTLTHVDMLNAKQATLDAELGPTGRGTWPPDQLSLTQRMVGQDLELSFVAPRELVEDPAGQVTVRVRNAAHPMHMWTFAGQTVKRPLPWRRWLGAAAGGLVLALGITLALRRFRQYRRRTSARSWRVARALRRGVLAPLALVRGFRKLLRWARTRGRQSRWRKLSRVFGQMAAETRCSLIAEKLGVSWRPLCDGPLPLFRLELGGAFPLPLDHCRVGFAAPDLSASAVQNALESLEQGSASARLTWIVATSVAQARDLKPALSRDPLAMVTYPAQVQALLQTPDPVAGWCQLIAQHIPPAAICPYQPGPGVARASMFFGRDGWIKRLREHRTCLIIAGHGLGKTSLLQAVQRSDGGNPEACVLLSGAAHGGLKRAVAKALHVSAEAAQRNESVVAELEARARQADGFLLLIDDADRGTFERSRSSDLELLRHLLRLSQQSPLRLVLSGDWPLLHWARTEGRELGLTGAQVCTLGPLEPSACRQLLRWPLEQIGGTLADTAVERALELTACRPDLLVRLGHALCVSRDDPQRVIQPQDLDRLIDEPQVAQRMERFTVAQFPLVDQLVVCAVAAAGDQGLTQEALVRRIGALAFHEPELDEALQRLRLACIVDSGPHGRLWIVAPAQRRALVNVLLRQVVAANASPSAGAVAGEP